MAESKLDESLIVDLAFQVCTEVSGCKYLYASLLTGAIEGVLHKRGLATEPELVQAIRYRVTQALSAMGFRHSACAKE